METPQENAPPVDLDRLVSRWVDTAIRVQDTFGKIENAFMASPENEIRSAIWDMFGEYTRTLAAQLSDDAEDARGWLEWFAWECDFGRKPMEMVFADGETLMVVGASDLLAAIRTDENGCRVWDSPANGAALLPSPAGGSDARAGSPALREDRAAAPEAPHRSPGPQGRGNADVDARRPSTPNQSGG